MGHTKHYTPDTDNVREACVDVLTWFAKPKMFKTFARMIKFGSPKGPYSIEQVCMCMSLAGVRGYPVDAMIKRYAPDGQLVSDGSFE